MKYTPVIGLEVHVELYTKSKMFCGCSASYFGEEPNSHVCPVCLGLPGALPYPNEEAIKWCVKIGLALGCQIPLFSKFDRKNYFYPDLSKGYQISQYDKPFCLNGTMLLSNGKRIGITRAHMEEDTGKLTHSTVDGKKVSLIDFNRSGVPLVEIVTEPDFESAQEVVEYLKNLQQIVRYLGVSQADMEKGDMRLEPNISLRKPGEKDLPAYKVEVKNINSFKFVDKAIQFEIERQTEILDKGEIPAQETRGFDESKNQTFSQRSKEQAHDYRYFPEPDIPPIRWSEADIKIIKESLPELPDEKFGRFQKDYGLSQYDASLLAGDRDLAGFYEEAVKAYPKGDPKRIANWIVGELLRRLNEQQKSIADINLLPASVAELLLFVDEGRITTSSAKEIFQKMISSGESAEHLIKELGAEALSQEELAHVVEQVIKTNEKAAQEYKAGKQQVFGFLVGQVQRQTQGKADPGAVSKLLKEKLG